MNSISRLVIFLEIQKNKYILIILFLFTTTFAFSQKELKMLEEAYKCQSTEKLKNFFDTWSREIPTITDAELSAYNDTIQQAYKLFVAFYKPSGKNFLITKNTIRIYFTDKIACTEQDVIKMLGRSSDTIDSITLKQIHWRVQSLLSADNCRTFSETLVYSIMDFRPAFHSNGRTRLFLTKKYDETLKQFLGIRQGDTMSAEERAKRKVFLNNYVEIYHHTHWGEWWQLYSYPTFDAILFDKDMEYAIINAGGISSGQELVFRRKGETWMHVGYRGQWTD